MVVEPCHLCQDSKCVLNLALTIKKKKKKNPKKAYQIAWNVKVIIKKYYSIASKLHLKYKINLHRSYIIVH